MQETYNMSRVMLPVYLFSFTFKFFALSTASMSSAFLITHKALRNNTRFLSSFDNRLDEVNKAPSVEHLSSTHFELLHEMWK
ncbi:hypothetical protein PMAYCL1PPCAC_21322, partial [Pristionchus mayeri]